MRTDEAIATVLLGLHEYNPAVYDWTARVSAVLVPIALVILATLMYLEMIETNRRVTIEQGNMNLDLLILVTWKYFLGFSMVILSGQVIDSLLWLNSAIGYLIDGIVTTKSELYLVVPEIAGNMSIIQRSFLAMMEGMAYMAYWFANLFVQLLIFLRFFQLYLYKAAAPILVASFVSEEWREIGITYMKQFLALNIQGFLLVLILKVYPILMNHELFTIVAEEIFLKNLAACFTSILHSMVLILALISSQTIAKKWMG